MIARSAGIISVYTLSSNISGPLMRRRASFGHGEALVLQYTLGLGGCIGTGRAQVSTQRSRPYLRSSLNM